MHQVHQHTILQAYSEEGHELLKLQLNQCTLTFSPRLFIPNMSIKSSAKHQNRFTTIRLLFTVFLNCKALLNTKMDRKVDSRSQLISILPINLHFSEADTMLILTLPLIVSGDLVTGGLWSVFSSICHPITVMLPTRSLSADLQQTLCVEIFLEVDLFINKGTLIKGY